MADNFVSFPVVVNDDGSLTTGTPFSAGYNDDLKTSLADNVYDSTNPTVKTKVIIAEVVLARGSMGSLDGRLDIAHNEDGTLKVKWVEHLITDTTVGSSVGAGETILSSYSVPASTLAVNQQALRFRCYGATVNNANAKTLKVYLGAGGTPILSVALTASSAALWVLEGVIVRTGSTTQVDRAEVRHASATPKIDIQALAGVETLANALLLKVTGTGVANGDITSAILEVWMDH